MAELGYSGQSVFDPASRAVLIDQLAAARERLTDATSARQAAENALAASINDVASAEQQAAASGATTQTQVVHAAEAKERLRKRVVESYVLGDRRLDIYTVVDDPVTFSQARTYLESITAAENDAMAQYRQAVAALDSVQRQLVDQIAALRRAATERQAAVDLTGVLQLQAMSEVASYEAGSHVYVPGFRMPVAGPAHFIDSWGFPRMAGTAKAHWHEGIDIMAPVGRELVATEPGTIFKVGTGCWAASACGFVATAERSTTTPTCPPWRPVSPTTSASRPATWSGSWATAATRPADRRICTSRSIPAVARR